MQEAADGSPELLQQLGDTQRELARLSALARPPPPGPPGERPMTFEEKRRLSIQIGESGPGLLQRIMRIVQSDPKVNKVRSFCLFFFLAFQLFLVFGLRLIGWSSASYACIEVSGNRQVHVSIMRHRALHGASSNLRNSLASCGYAAAAVCNCL